MPCSTTSARARFTVWATSGAITRRPSAGIRASRASYGVPAPTVSRSTSTVGSRMPSLTMMPISSARAAGRSPELPMAVPSDGVSETNG